MPRVLVIDDDSRIRALCRAVLEDAGFQVDEAPDGETALGRYRACPADVVLCDIVMPKRDGLMVTADLLAIDPEARVVAMTGALAGSVDLLALALSAGACDVLEKPFHVDELVEVVCAALEPVLSR